MNVEQCIAGMSVPSVVKDYRGNLKMKLVKLKCKNCKKLFTDEGDMRQPWLCIDCRPSKMIAYHRGGVSRNKETQAQAQEHPRCLRWEPEGHLLRLREEDKTRQMRRWTKYEDM